MHKLDERPLTATRAHAMLHDSPSYQSFVDYHGRWVTQAKAAKIVRSLQQLDQVEAEVKVQDWIDTDEVIVNRSGMVNMASIFLAMGY